MNETETAILRALAAGPLPAADFPLAMEEFMGEFPPHGWETLATMSERGLIGKGWNLVPDGEELVPTGWVLITEWGWATFLNRGGSDA